MAQYVRPLSFENSQFEFPGGYKGQPLYWGEDCILIATKIPPGVSGPANHVHQFGDQTYFVWEGEVSIALADKTEKVPTNSLVFIPQGLPHHNWNDGEGEELHLEVIAPGVRLRTPVSVPTDSTENEGLTPYIRAADESKFTGDGLQVDWLATQETGSVHSAIYLAEGAPGASAPPLHIHPTNQYYFTLEGEMNVQIALEEFTVGPMNLVVLPAGVPHRQWNGGTVKERHLSIIVPSPSMIDGQTKAQDPRVELTKI